MIAGTVAPHDLGITKSHSRARVSNDNPFIEAHFTTLKYRPDYPERFTARPHPAKIPITARISRPSIQTS